MRTPFGWLSRDPAEVAKYITHPLFGGFESTVKRFIVILVALPDVARPAPVLVE